jgi:hypothetical protein
MTAMLMLYITSDITLGRKHVHSEIYPYLGSSALWRICQCGTGSENGYLTWNSKN